MSACETSDHSEARIRELDDLSNSLSSIRLRPPAKAVQFRLNVSRLPNRTPAQMIAFLNDRPDVRAAIKG
jgi:hypothetical protein